MRTIVVIGTPAGGMETLTRLLACLSEDTAVAFFIAQHIARELPSLFAQLFVSNRSLSK